MPLTQVLIYIYIFLYIYDSKCLNLLYFILYIYIMNMYVCVLINSNDIQYNIIQHNGNDCKSGMNMRDGMFRVSIVVTLVI